MTPIQSTLEPAYAATDDPSPTSGDEHVGDYPEDGEDEEYLCVK